jgi:methylamine dehydrogenase heavy chain
MNLSWWDLSRLLAGSALALAAGGAHAQPQTPRPPPLPAETSDVAVLPPATPHRVFVTGASAGASIIDAEDDHLRTIGVVPIEREGIMALSRDAQRIVVAEHFYSRGNRGTREDVLAVYDGHTLNLLHEIVIPGRLLVVPRPNLFELSDDGRLAYVYDMIPASQVHVVDLQENKLVSSVDLPGCALAMPYGPRSFASICGDGTIGTTEVPLSGAAAVTFTKPFFDANSDPLFEASVVDKTTGEAWFMSYSGKIFPAKLGSKAVIGKPWSVSAAGGLAAAGTGVQELAWRPGGAGQMLALHRALKRLYVLMHTGNYWTHKAPGTEVWVLDAARQTLIRRIPLERPAQGIAVSQDANPLLYVMGEEDEFAVLDATTGEKLRKRKMQTGLAWVPGN